MQITTNCDNNIFSSLKQYKIFHLVEYKISDDDPVRKLSDILEAMDFSKLMQVFSHKTKIHPVRMFAIIIYAYSRGIYSTRNIEIACHENIKFRFLLQNSKIPDHSTISRFLTKIENLLPELFEQFFKIIFELENISTDTIYIDGTKIEAYVNKYIFVWRGSIQKNRLRLDEKIETLISDFKKNRLFRKDGLELDYFFNSETEKKLNTMRNLECYQINQKKIFQAIIVSN